MKFGLPDYKTPHTHTHETGGFTDVLNAQVGGFQIAGYGGPGSHIFPYSGFYLRQVSSYNAPLIIKF